MVQSDEPLRDDPSLKYLRVRGSEIAYRIVGRGPTLVLVTGWPFNSKTYEGIIPYLSNHFRCVLLDSPGLGLTRWSEDTDFTFPGQARTFSEFLGALGIERYYLVAHNTGATIARLMAAEHGPRVVGFAILNTEIPHDRPPWLPLYARLMRLPGSTFLFRSLLRINTFIRSPMGFGGCYSDKSLLDRSFMEAYIRPLLTDPKRLRGIMKYLSVGLDFDLIDNLPHVHAQIHSPVTLVWGQSDPTFPVSGAREMVREFGGYAELKEIEKGKLLAHEEFPIQVASAILAAFTHRVA